MAHDILVCRQASLEMCGEICVCVYVCVCVWRHVCMDKCVGVRNEGTLLAPRHLTGHAERAGHASSKSASRHIQRALGKQGQMTCL